MASTSRDVVVRLAAHADDPGAPIVFARDYNQDVAALSQTCLHLFGAAPLGFNSNGLLVPPTLLCRYPYLYEGQKLEVILSEDDMDLPLYDPLRDDARAQYSAADEMSDRRESPSRAEYRRGSIMEYAGAPVPSEQDESRGNPVFILFKGLDTDNETDSQGYGPLLVYTETDMEAVARVVRVGMHMSLLSLMEVFGPVFQQAVQQGVNGTNAVITPEAFGTRVRLIQKRLQSAGLHHQDAAGLATALWSLFDVLDVEDSGCVCVDEVCASAALLCNGSKADKLAVVFSLFDEQGEGFLTPEQLRRCLKTILMTLLGLSRVKNRYAKHSLHEWAYAAVASSVERAFGLSVRARNDRISLPELREWVNRYPGMGTVSWLRVLDVLERFSKTQSSGDETDANVVATDLSAAMSRIDEIDVECSEQIDLLRGLFCFNEVTISKLLQSFGADMPRHLTPKDYEICVRRLLPISEMEPEPRALVADYLASVFEAFEFDLDGSADSRDEDPVPGVVDKRELVLGLSLLCSGSMVEKLMVAWNVYGGEELSISRRGLHPIINAYLTILNLLNPASFQNVGSDELVAQIELTADLSHEVSCMFFELLGNQDDNNDEADQKITFQRFVELYKRYQTAIPFLNILYLVGDNVTTGADSTSDFEQSLQAEENAALASAQAQAHSQPQTDADDADADEDEDDASDDNVDARDSMEALTVAHATLRRVPFRDLMRAIGQRTRDGSISHDDLLRATTSLAQQFSGLDEDDVPVFQEVMSRLYSFFADDGQALSVSITSALVMLADASNTEKLGLGFVLMDSDRDGYLEPQELAEFLSCTLKLVLSLSSGTEYDGDLAKAVHQTAGQHTAHIFRAVDENQLGRISFQQFREATESGEVAPWLKAIQALAGASQDPQDPTPSAPPQEDDESTAEDSVAIESTSTMGVLSTGDGARFLAVLVQLLLKVSVSEFIRAFTRIATEQKDEGITRSAMMHAVGSLSEVTHPMDKRLVVLLDNVFSMFQTGKGVADVKDIVLCLHFLCGVGVQIKGGSEDKLEGRLASAFLLVDSDMDGKIDLTQFYLLCSSFMKLLGVCNAMNWNDPRPLPASFVRAVNEQVSVDAKEITVLVFARAQRDEEDRIGFNDFRNLAREMLPWIPVLEALDAARDKSENDHSERDRTVTPTTRPQQASRHSGGSGEVKEESQKEKARQLTLMKVPLDKDLFVEVKGAHVVGISLVRKLLSPVKAGTLLEGLMQHAAQDAKTHITLQGFEELLKELLPAPVLEITTVHMCLMRIFFAYEVDGLASLPHLFCGLNLVRASSDQSGTLAALKVFDLDDDEKVTQEQVEMVMRAMLQLLVGFTSPGRGSEEQSRLRRHIPVAAQAYAGMLWDHLQTDEKTVSCAEVCDTGLNMKLFPWSAVLRILDLVSGGEDK